MPSASGSALDVAVDHPARAPRRRLVFAVVAVALFMASVDLTIVATALPALERDLGAAVNWSSWTITAYTLGQILMMPIAGTLGERYGRKLVFLVAATVFTVASLLCGLANDIEVLVGLRVVQALGGGAFMPSATGIVAAMFGDQRDRALGAFSSILPIGGVVGPVIGGVLLEWLSWRWIFLVNVPFGIALVVAGAVVIPRDGRGGRVGRFDVVGVVLLVVALLSLMVGASLAGGAGDLPFALGALALSACAAFGFFRHTRAPTSFLPRELLVGRGFGVMNVLNVLYGTVALGLGALIPLYAHDRYGIDNLHAGTLMATRAAGMVAAAAAAVVVLRRFGYRRPIVLGLGLIVVGMTAMALIPSGSSSYLWLSAAAAVLGLGMGTMAPAANNATLQLAPEHAASIAGLRGMFRHGGGLVAISVVSSVLARSEERGTAQAVMIAVVCLPLACAVPLVRRAPDHRGAW